MYREPGFVLRKSFCLALLILFFAGPALMARVWTDRQGRQTDAQFVRVRGDNVVLQKGLKPLVIPLSEFCDEDQEYIKEQTKGKGGAKPPAGGKKDADAADDSAPSSPTLKSKKTKTADPSNPFEPVEEKASSDDSHAEELKPKAEKAEIPKINTDGGFDERTWTDIKSNKLTANFSRLEGKIVVLLKKGEEKRFPIDQFTYNDKLYIRQAALDLQKYQKFAGNREKADPPSGMAAQGGMPGPMNQPAMPRMPAPPGNPMFEAMQQQAAALQQQQEERNRQSLADNEKQRQQAEEARRQQDAQRQLAADQDRQRQEEQNRRMEEQRRLADAQMQQNLNGAAPPVPTPVSAAPSDQQFYSKQCLSCKKLIPSSSKLGDRCPHCGVIWEEEEDEHGRVIARSTSETARITFGFIFFVVAALVALAKRLRR